MLLNSHNLPVQTHHNNFRLTLSNFFDECKKFQSKSHSIVPTFLKLVWALSTGSKLFCDYLWLTWIRYKLVLSTYLLKRGTTWNQLKSSETTWNHLKPPRNYLKPPEITWNKPYCSIFLLKISYSQVEFILILCP